MARRRTIELDRKTYQDDGRFIDWKKEFRLKEEFLGNYYEEVEQEDFVRDFIPMEYLDDYVEPQEVGEKSVVGESTHSGKGVGLIKLYEKTVPVIDKETKQQKINEKTKEPLFQDVFTKWYLYSNYKGLLKTKSMPARRKALINPCSYFGRYKKGHKAQVDKCFGLVIDLDYVGLQELQNLFGMMENYLIPYPTYIANSGKGIHLYYVFEKPVDVHNEENEEMLNLIKKELIYLIWTDKTSRDPSIQEQKIKQDIRIPGSWSKLGYTNKVRCDYIIKVFKISDKVDLTYLKEFIEDKYLEKMEDLASDYAKEKLTLEEARRLYPKWAEEHAYELENNITFEHKKENYKKDYHYKQNRGLYEWWLRIITQQDARHPKYTTREGNRYHAIWILFVIAAKTKDVSFDEVYQKALELIPLMNEREHQEDNEFTIKDVQAASYGYKEKLTEISNKFIEEITGIELPPPTHLRRPKETRLKQKDHLEIARAIRDIKQKQKGTIWTQGNGRPLGSGTKQDLVKKWRESHPNGSKYACQKDLGLDKKTIRKWWE